MTLKKLLDSYRPDGKTVFTIYCGQAMKCFCPFSPLTWRNYYDETKAATAEVVKFETPRTNNVYIYLKDMEEVNDEAFNFDPYDHDAVTYGG